MPANECLAEEVISSFLELLQLPRDERESLVENYSHDTGELSSEVIDLLRQDLLLENRGLLVGGIPFSEVIRLDPSEIEATHIWSSQQEGQKKEPGEFSPGDRVGVHKILRRLDSGGMGDVYLAEDTRVGRTVALKVLTRGGPERFEQETRAIAGLEHPGIVRLYDTGDIDGCPYFTMEYIAGQTLAQRIKEMPNGFLTPTEAAKMLLEVAEAIAYAHENGVLHRDIKPNNIFIDRSGKPRVGDFGLAKLLDDDSELTRTGEVFGSPQFMAPEQTGSTGNDVSKTTDIYGLGATLYMALVGKPPFQGNSPIDVLKMVISEEPAPPGKLVAGTPKDIETICLKCLEKIPALRYSSVNEFAEDLQHFLRREPIVARPVSHAEKIRRWCVRKPAIAALLLTACLLLVSLGGWAVSRIQSRQEAKLRFSEALVIRSDLFAQQGKWQSALTDLKEAERLGHPDPRLIQLKRVSALLAISDTNGFEVALKKLERMAPLGPHEGEACLMRGLSLLLVGETTEAMDDFRQALESPHLSSPKQYIARAMLADTSPEVVRLLTLSVEKEKTSHLAQQYLISMLILLGRYDEAEMRCEVAEAIFPDSPTFPMLLVFIDAALGRNNLENHKILAQATQQVPATDLAAFQSSLDSLSKLTSHFAGNWCVDATEDEFRIDRSQLSSAIDPLLDRWSELVSKRTGTYKNLGFDVNQHSQVGGVVPCVLQAFQPLSDMASLRTFGFLYTGKGNTQRIDRLIDELERSFEKHPDAVLQLARGRLLFARERLPEAISAYDLSAMNSSIWHRVPEHAAYSAAYCAWKAYNQGNLGAIEIAAKNTRRCIHCPEIAAKRISILFDVAEVTGDYESAQQFAQFKNVPSDSEVRLARVALTAGLFDTATKHCKKAATIPDLAIAAQETLGLIQESLRQRLLPKAASTTAVQDVHSRSD